MSSRRLALLDALQGKLAESRQHNRVEVVAEARRMRQSENANDDEKNRKMDGDKASKASSILASRLVDPSAVVKPETLVVTAEQDEAQASRKRKKVSNANSGLQNDRDFYLSLKRRIHKSGVVAADGSDDDGDGRVNEPDVKKKTPAHGVPENLVDRMVNELEEHRAKSRAAAIKRSRRVTTDEVDAVNTSNDYFNRRVEKAMGGATLEIKANLERGTALPD